MGEYVVEMKGISKSFPGTKALDNVDFSIKHGEVHALIGENGAGKSTLMNILTGQVLMDEGKILIDGKNEKIMSPKDAFSKSIVLVPQELNLIPDASVSENIFLGNEIRSKGFIDWKETDKRSKEVLELLGVKIDVKQKVKSLSAAYQQLVSIARALSYSPKVLILDEPTAVLSANEVELLFKSMHRLKKKGTTIIFITHHLDEVLSQADRMTIMRDGRKVKVANVEEISKDEIINTMAGRTVKKTKRIDREYSQDIFLETKNITRLGEFTNVSFEVNKGQILCVAGLVGSGRTEIFKSVFGITQPENGGKIYVEGKEVKIKNPLTAIKLGIGYVSEERRHDGITPGMSVMENMMLPSFSQFKKKGVIDFKEVEKTYNYFAKKVKVKTASKDTLIKNLSGGNQQKVIVARWLAKGIKMLIMDEPTRGIDVNAKGEIHQLIRELADSGVAVVVISSEMEEVLALADKIMVVNQGKIQGFINNVGTISESDVLKVAFQ